MKSYRKELWFNIPTRRAFINITPQVETCLKESGIQEGMALINDMAVTAHVHTASKQRSSTFGSYPTLTHHNKTGLFSEQSLLWYGSQQ